MVYKLTLERTNNTNNRWMNEWGLIVLWVWSALMIDNSCTVVHFCWFLDMIKKKSLDVFCKVLDHVVASILILKTSSNNTRFNTTDLHCTLFSGTFILVGHN